jgi:hypothetical protein
MKHKYIFILSIFFLLLSFSSDNLFSQALRRVLFEEWTSSTCGPCASNNPILNAFIEAHWDTITAVKYHVGWPSPGNDPMYLYNPTQSYDRRYYYNVNAVPWLNVDGVILDIWPFSTQAFQNAMIQRIGTPTPVSISVTDQRIPGDSNKATVVLTKLSNLPSGTYYLRVMAVEKKVIYQTPPGPNGETIFPEVFRWAFPNSTGTLITATAGTETYIFKYKIENPPMVDSMIYTIAFLQNDINKEVLNSGIGYGSLIGIDPKFNNLPAKYILSQNYPNPFNPSTLIYFEMPKDGNVSLKVFDILGNEVKTLVEGYHKAGTYNIYFTGSDIASGVYYYRLTADGFTDTKKMVLVK